MVKSVGLAADANEEMSQTQQAKRESTPVLSTVMSVSFDELPSDNDDGSHMPDEDVIPSSQSNDLTTMEGGDTMNFNELSELPEKMDRGAEPRHRTVSEDFHRLAQRCESTTPTMSRRSQLPTYYRAFYTGVWYKDIRTHCYPHGWNDQYWPLLLSFLAEVFTIWGSFSCQYFRGASIDFTSGRYGIWTLEDTYEKCQLYSVIFYAIDLGGPLRWSRVMSMSAMVLGLAVLTTMAQAMQCHIISWGVGLILFVVFLVSVSTTSTFNIWIVWALFNYILFVLIVRAAFVHPVARRISNRGCRIIAGIQISCFVFTILTLVVLRSDFCTCDSLTPGELAGRITEESEPCENVCALHVSGYMVICASGLWLLGSLATLRFGVQPALLVVARPPEMYANYSHASITSRVAAGARNFHRTLSSPRKWIGPSERSGKSNHTDAETPAGPSSVDPASSDSVDNSESFVTVSSPSAREVRFDDNVASSTKTDSRDDELEVGSSSLVDKDEDTHGLDEEDEDWPPKRSRCQKCCCDFRVTPRSRNEKILFWSFRCTLGFIIGLYTFLVILMIGSRAENLNAQEAPDTSPYFITDLVCAYDPLDSASPFVTFPDKQAAQDEGWVVAHCGACGVCSNMADIKTYVDTRQTIAASAKKCGPVNFFGSFSDLVDCIQDRIPFSDDCAVCWAENMSNTGRECLFTCLSTLFTGFMASNNIEGAGSDGWLNHCLYCDEKLSGPAFVTCSGVSRRRLGIVSEIERNPAEQCRHVDIDWVNVDISAL